MQGYVTCVQRNDLIGCIFSSCLIWGSLAGCLWLVVPKFYLRSECIDSGLGFGLWTQTAKALEPRPVFFKNDPQKWVISVLKNPVRKLPWWSSG